MDRSSDTFARSTHSLQLGVANLALESSPTSPSPLSAVPPEIKLKIVEAYCEDASRWEMVQLQRVSQDFAEMTRPFLWNELDLIYPTDRAIHHLISTLTPTNARFVQYVGLGAAIHESFESGVTTAEAFVDGKAIPRPVLFKTLIEQLPLLSSITLDFSLVEEHSDVKVKPVISALGSRSLQVCELKITNKEYSGLACLDDFSSFIKSLPHLQRLSFDLDDDFDYHEARFHDFGISVASLRHLRILEISGSLEYRHFGQRKHIATWPWVCPIEELTLLEDCPSDVAELLLLLQRFSTTLRRVRMGLRAGEADEAARVEAWCEERGVKWGRNDEEEMEYLDDGTWRDCEGADEASQWD